MRARNRWVGVLSILLWVPAGVASAQDCPGCGHGQGQGAGASCKHARAAGGQAGHGRGGAGRHGRGHGHDAQHAIDRDVFLFLIDHRDVIERQVTELPNGVETRTESDVPAVAAMIREHVRAMADRLHSGRPIHQRDPLFAEIFKHTEDIEMRIEETDRGLVVRETSKEPAVVRLIQAHAEVVSGFVERGRAEMHRDHPVPQADPSTAGQD